MFQSTPASGWHASQTQKRKNKYFNPHPLPDGTIKISQHQAYVKPPQNKKAPTRGAKNIGALAWRTQGTGTNDREYSPRRDITPVPHNGCRKKKVRKL